MPRKLLAVFTVLALVASPAFGASADKDGTPSNNVPPSVQGDTSAHRADFEYNTGGAIDFVPESGGSAAGWGEWFIGTVLNDTGEELTLTELGFPCSGAPTGDYGWVVWTDVGGINAPAGDASTADYFGAFAPTDPAPDTLPPTVYSYIDVSGANIVIAPGAYFCFGYDVTGNGGQTAYNGVETWAWYGDLWDPDSSYGRTAILQVKGSTGVVPVMETTWGSLKGLYQ